MHDLNDLYYFAMVVDHGGLRLPSARWGFPNRV